MTTSAARKTDSEPVIRAAVAADLPACAKIINDYIDAAEWLPRVKTRDEIAGFFTAELLASRTVIVAEVGGAVAAYLSASPDGFVHAIYLAAPFRGQGIGKLLLDHVKAIHPGQLELTVFEPNVAARRFYEREGFVEVPEGRKEDTDEGVPVLLLRWRPASSSPLGERVAAKRPGEGATPLRPDGGA